MINKELIRQAADDIDIFEEDLSAEYEQICKSQSHRIIMWSWVAAACVAGVVIMFLTPPKADGNVDAGETVVAEVVKKKSEIKETKEEAPQPEVVAEASQTPKPQKTNNSKQENQPEKAVAAEAEPVQMSEETKMELLMTSLMPQPQTVDDIDIEEDIRQMRMRESRMLASMNFEH